VVFFVETLRVVLKLQQALFGVKSMDTICYVIKSVVTSGDKFIFEFQKNWSNILGS
jgi:hypothetical protein